MVNELPSVTFKAIGIVRNKVKQDPGGSYDWQSVTSEIVIDDNLTEALDGLEEFSHIIVLFWLHHQAVNHQLLSKKTHPMGKPELPLVGRLATRSPHRPNPLGEATVRLLQRHGHILQVSGLDAIDGTPILDIKPYLPDYDAPTDNRVPAWTAHQ